jgi:hypothetical protein
LWRGAWRRRIEGEQDSLEKGKQFHAMIAGLAQFAMLMP